MASVDILWRLVETATGRTRKSPCTYSTLIESARNLAGPSLVLSITAAAAMWKYGTDYEHVLGKHEPAISGSTAALLSILFTSLYVLPFYLFRKTRPSPSLNRDAPSVIQARIRAVTIAVTISTLTTLYLLHDKGQLSIVSSLHYLGLWPISPLAMLQPLLLTMLLFTGPLFEDVYLNSSLTPLPNVWTELVTSLSSSIGYRNYIAGPLTEELLFRSTILPIHLLSPLAESPKSLIFLTPLYFGIAHVHHFYEFRLNHPDTSLLPSVLRTVFQFTYTTIFGWYVAFIYLRTGSLIAVFLVHAFCNYMGLPRFWGKIRIRSQFSGPYKRSRPLTRGKDDPVLGTQETSRSGQSRLDQEMLYTMIYYVLLLIGAFGFSQGLFRLTNFESQALVSFDTKTKI